MKSFYEPVTSRCGADYFCSRMQHRQQGTGIPCDCISSPLASVNWASPTSRLAVRLKSQPIWQWDPAHRNEWHTHVGRQKISLSHCIAAMSNTIAVRHLGNAFQTSCAASHLEIASAIWGRGGPGLCGLYQLNPSGIGDWCSALPTTFQIAHTAHTLFTTMNYFIKFFQDTPSSNTHIAFSISMYYCR